MAESPYESVCRLLQEKENAKALLKMATLIPEIRNGINFDDAIVRDVILTEPSLTVEFYGNLGGDKIGDLAKKYGVPAGCLHPWEE